MDTALIQKRLSVFQHLNHVRAHVLLQVLFLDLFKKPRRGGVYDRGLMLSSALHCSVSKASAFSSYNEFNTLMFWFSRTRHVLKIVQGVGSRWCPFMMRAAFGPILREIGDYLRGIP